MKTSYEESSNCSKENDSISSDNNSYEDNSSSDNSILPYPGFVEYSLKYLKQDSKPRIWCLKLITNPYPFSIKVLFLKILKRKTYYTAA